MEKGTISKITVDYNISLISVNKADFSKINDIVASLSDAKINIRTITMTQTLKDSSSLMFSLEDDSVDVALKTLKENIDGVFEVSKENAKIVISGNGFKSPLSGINDILDTIIFSGVEIKLFSTTDTELSVIVDKIYSDKIIDILKPFE